MKKPSDVFNSIRFAKMEPKHDKGHVGGSTDDEEHGAVSEKEWDQQIQHAKKRAMMNTEEVKDKTDIGEYDQEGDMAKSDLRSIIANAKKMHDMIDDADNLPEWCQSKITLAEDYISTVANYMTSELDEEAKLEEATSAAVRLHRALQKEKEKRERNERAGQELLNRPKKPDEPKQQGVAESSLLEYGDTAKGQKMLAKVQKRAVDRVTSRKADTNPKYAKKNSDTAKRAWERMSGVDEEVEQIDEGRPSQRHPLEGHEYHKKSDEALIHIAKDAHAAAEAMKSHNTTAENKYRDQANDSATVRHFRKTHGMADWYKKKYGHMKESFRPMDEPNFNNSIEARQKRADDAKKPPFDGPYKKSTGVVTDKSGAKHTPMSRARDLARQAAKRQAAKLPVKESLEESRKSDIVKEAFKKAKKKNDDTFQPEPELGSTVVKADN